MDEMKACPFCGGKKVGAYADAANLWVGLCQDCGARGPEAPFAKDAVEKWNHRALDVSGLGVVRLASPEQIAAGKAEELARFAPEGGE